MVQTEHWKLNCPKLPIMVVTIILFYKLRAVYESCLRTIRMYTDLRCIPSFYKAKNAAYVILEPLHYAVIPLKPAIARHENLVTEVTYRY